MGRSFIRRGVNPMTKAAIEFPSFGLPEPGSDEAEKTGICLEPLPEAPSRSHFRGAPLMAPGMDWPSGPNGPLNFLLCIDFAELDSGAASSEGLPSNGVLNIFYDCSGSDWVFKPDAPAYWKLIYEAGDLSELQSPNETGAPCGIRFGTATGSAQSPRHQLGGLPHWIQGDGRMAIELLSGRYLSNPSVVSELKRARVAPESLRKADRQSRLEVARALDAAQVDPALFDKGALEWRLLVQVDSDPALSFDWGDSGRLYVMIPQASLDAFRFEDACITWQSY